MKFAHLGWALAVIGWAISIGIQFDMVDKNTELRHQLEITRVERDNAVRGYAVCEGDMKP